MKSARTLWLSASLEGKVEALADAPAPVNCRQLLTCLQVDGCFAYSNDYPMHEGKELKRIKAQDRQINIDNFGVHDPRQTLKEFDAQFDAIKPDLTKFKAGIDLLKCVYDFVDGLAIELDDAAPINTKTNMDMKERARAETEVAKSLAQAIRIAEIFLQENKK